MLTVLTTIITAISSIIVAYIANNKREERILSLLQKLTELTKNDTHNKFEVSKLFEMTTGLKVSYSDIRKIISDDNSIWIIHMLKKTPGLVSYQDGDLTYNDKFKNKKIRFSIDLIEQFYLYSSFILMSASVVLFTFSNSLELKAFFGILLFVFTFAWVFMLRSRGYSKKVKEIVENV
jgi:hypothetical protein